MRRGPKHDIPFNRPYLTGREMEYVRQAVEAGHISGDGSFTRDCQQLLEDSIGAPRVLLTTSCTDALEMSALLLDTGPGDEIIVPSFTFVSTANAFALRGARLVFADVRPDTLNIDERQLESLVTPRTRAVVVVHYAGVGCEMGSILDLAGREGFDIIEDNAHGLFGRYKGRSLGTFGRIATQSFHETKNVSCGEGGALVLNDESLLERAEILRDKGTNRKRFLRGQVDKYSWVDIGSSFLPSDLLAAYLYAQLTASVAIQERRAHVYHRYADELAGWAKENDVRLPFVPEYCEQPFHMFYMLMPTETARDGLIAALREKSILAVFHYVPLHLSVMGRRYGGKEGDCPVTESVSGRLVRLPFYTGMTAGEQDRVIEAVRGFDVPA